MTFYHHQVLHIRQEIFPGDDACQQVVRARKFIDDHFDENIKLDVIAGEAFFSKFHFLRIFKLLYGETPHQYLIALRLKKAKQLLQEDKSISETCFLIGFESVSSFKGLFKRYSGLSPAIYQRRQCQLTQSIRNPSLPLLKKAISETGK